MVNNQTASKIEATPLTPETELDFWAASKHVEPAARYFDRQRELARLTAEVDESYVVDGVGRLEEYANASPEVRHEMTGVERIAHIGVLINDLCRVEAIRENREA